MTLETRLPYNLLPEKLIVHDPWGVLSAHGVRDDNTRWEEKKDITYTYHLSLSADGLSKKEKSKEDILKKWSDKCSQPGALYFSEGREPDENGLVDAPVIVDLPPPPCPITDISEAHVYFRPSEAAGSGNHSFAYNVEWELPRSIFIQPTLCMTCVSSAVEKVVSEKFEGRARPRGTHASEIRIEKAGIVTNIITKGEYDRATSGAERPKFPYNPKRAQRLSDPEFIHIDMYDGDAIHLGRNDIDIQYQHPYTGLGPCCEHLQKSNERAPLTCTTRVIAKISIKGDTHLSKEAKNYQSFPDHFFEHWSGFNLVSPIHDPVPVGAVVPQFYGYYEPDSDQTPIDDKGKHRKSKYLSPIMLLEECGEQVDIDQLNIDDRYMFFPLPSQYCDSQVYFLQPRNECASLFYRLHSAGWIHGSVYPRNILVKKGAIDDIPLARMLAPDTLDNRFRLIDFGRSFKFKIPEGLKDEVFFHRMTGIGNAVDVPYEATRMREESYVVNCCKVLRMAPL